MKTQDFKHGNGLGSSTTDRAFNDQNEKLKERGISNAGGQRSFQTSSKDSAHKAQKRKPLL
ncbi:hypothetical protein [Mucilaginibacter sp. dw_454]|uniref:hypothetical protein n=1 Tax=Mucilaginibacter sp. dw_454 TaxID=2720079 RepID=UPI001BD2BA8A|nr:hypothetical protein [Mucilaginibacter sp. dw_454]